MSEGGDNGSKAKTIANSKEDSHIDSLDLDKNEKTTK
jgi:hypothetical protein